VKRRIRKIFGDIHEVVQMPNLIEVQREILRAVPALRSGHGLCLGPGKTLRSVFPIQDFAGTASLDIKERDGYVLEAPKYDVTECRQRGITYSAPMKVTLRWRPSRSTPRPRPSRSSISRSRTSTWAISRS
jgi:DNA-directed RNA polymerase subunit beta